LKEIVGEFKAKYSKTIKMDEDSNCFSQLVYSLVSFLKSQGFLFDLRVNEKS
jgi:hypothetical protein